MGHLFLVFDVHICSSELPPHEKLFFLLPDICTPQEKNFEYLNQNIFLGSNGRMDVACAISDFKIIIKFGNGPQENNLHHQMGLHKLHYNYNNYCYHNYNNNINYTTLHYTALITLQHTTTTTTTTAWLTHRQRSKLNKILPHNVF